MHTVIKQNVNQMYESILIGIFVAGVGATLWFNNENATCQNISETYKISKKRD